MPEEEETGTDLERLLHHLEDYTLTVHNCQSIINALDAEDIIQVPVIEKVLALCVRDIKDDVKNSVNLLNIIFTIIIKIKKTQFSTLPDFVPSAIAVLHILKTTALINRVDSMKFLCFKIINSYPDETLIFLVINHSTELMELFNMYCHQCIPMEIKLKPIDLIKKLLNILPPDKKSIFVNEGIDIWFSKIIASITINSAIPHVLEVLELMMNDLMHIDYAENSQWKVVLANICTPLRYPALMKRLLEEGNDTWHRLWMIFVKLLKNQITKSSSPVGSPINSMLPVVETAFKMDVINRCRAFECWNVLIDNFSTETNEVYINKRIKLLTIPLTSNNAKVENTALAKLNTWWHLITRFYTRLDSFSDMILIPFLHFCFGKPIVSDKPVLISGMISKDTKVQCVQAFINMFGNTHCERCVALPKLKGKLITTKLLVSHWKDWIHALSNALKICTDYSEFSEEDIKYLWKSFITTIGELPENNIRRDLYNEILTLLGKLAEGCDNNLANNILNILIVVLFDKDDKIKSLMKSKDEQNAPIHKIVTIILKLPLSNLENRHTVIDNFKSLSTFLVEEAFKTSSHTIESIIKYLPSNGLLLWISLADTICELIYTLCPRMLCKMILWPFTTMDTFLNEELATSAWLNMYKSLYPVLHMTNINEEIIKELSTYHSNLPSNNFTLTVAVAMLELKIKVEHGPNFVNEVEFLEYIIIKVNKFHDLTLIYPSLTEVIVLVLNNLVTNTNVAAAKSAISTIGTILNLCLQITNDSSKEVEVSKNLESVFKALESIFGVEVYSKLKLHLIDHLKSSAPFLKKNQCLKDYLLAIFRGIKDEENIGCNVQELIKAFEDENKFNDTKNDSLNQQSDEVKFTTPTNKPINKKLNKKETGISNTFVENGEEYVVVKSNWKFNPRKLTDNQKEKLQRKREDIPALYQDLSQSQDEFKLTTWKTDSQDTTTTSKSASEQGADDVSSILKNIPNSEFVPKILENIMGKDKEDSQTIAPSKENSKIAVNKEENKKDDIHRTQIALKNTKSPRLALKDRVFRNVRNLIEKSNISNEGGNMGATHVENVLNTPTMKGNALDNQSNSAPPQICLDRPSRVKRKPKKFDNLELIGLKKTRFSAGQNDSRINSDITVTNTPENILNEPPKDLNVPKEKEENLTDSTTNQVIENIPKESVVSIIEAHPKEIDPEVQHKNETIDDEPNLTKNIAKALDENNDIIQENEPERLENDNNKDIELNTNTKNLEEKNKITNVQKSAKKTGKKQSRIEKELAIDMVEGHPFLKVQPEKRLTRKAISNSPCTRKSLSQKLNKSKSEPKHSQKPEKKVKVKEKSISIKETQNSNNEDIPMSQDIIESSQESSFTTISVKSTKNVEKKILTVALEDIIKHGNGTQNLLEDNASNQEISNTANKYDIDFSRNKTADDNALIDLTENLDTETINNYIIIINDGEDQTVIVSKDKSIDQSTQNTAEADTQSLDPSILIKEDIDKPAEVINNTSESNPLIESSIENVIDTTVSLVTTPNDITQTISETVLDVVEKKDLNSPFKDEEQRKKDFLNNTFEISPIKTLSPMREKKSPSPETSSDYVVIKLSSPVQSNGEPLEKLDSPEIFTEDKISPDKRDQSPPRQEVSVTNTSPSSSLSLKKNRPHVRSIGRAAQMLGLCVPDRLQTTILSDKSSDADGNKKSPSLNTTARRNLRVLYNSSSAETQDNSDDQEDSDNFLKFKRNLPATDCSPSGPILKRKLIDITDETTASPASKRKRVSFHDPPVSTTVNVKKYIEPSGVRSPQNCAHKRQERQMRSQLATKSPRKLDNVFKLVSALTKTVESFAEPPITVIPDDSEMSSIEQTPIAQVINTTELNDTDPICSELVDCKDSISNIASELSSPAMKVLLIKEFDGKIVSVGDLAKMTELEINRLCIKAPKVQVAKRVLTDYLKKVKTADEEITPTVEAAMSESGVPEAIPIEVSNEALVRDIEMQTDEVVFSSDGTQTDSASTMNCGSQTNESGDKTTADIVTTCLKERTDFVDHLCDKMDESSKKKIVDNLSYNALTDVFMNILTKLNSSEVLNRVIEVRSKIDSPNEVSADRRLSIVQDYLCERFESKDLVLFCSDLLKKVYQKS